jgi:hypothetical protein
VETGQDRGTFSPEPNLLKNRRQLFNHEQGGSLGHDDRVLQRQKKEEHLRQISASDPEPGNPEKPEWKLGIPRLKKTILETDLDLQTWRVCQPGQGNLCDSEPWRSSEVFAISESWREMGGLKVHFQSFARRRIPLEQFSDA